jgi:hypothetical protein
MTTLVARLINAGAMHELHCEGGKYSMRLFVHEACADRELTIEEAGEWVDTVRKLGGDVSREVVRHD